jgi:hypothetical protein
VMTSPKQTYIFQGVEVVMTGRIAIRETPTTRGKQPIKTTLYEVTPADKEEGSWKRWAGLSDMYKVIDGGTNDAD